MFDADGGPISQDTDLLDEHLKCGMEMTVVATADNGHVSEFPAICRIDTPVEIEYYRNGGILHRVLRQMLKA